MVLLKRSKEHSSILAKLWFPSSPLSQWLFFLPYSTQHWHTFALSPFFTIFLSLPHHNLLYSTSFLFSLLISLLFVVSPNFSYFSCSIHLFFFLSSISYLCSIIVSFFDTFITWLYPSSGTHIYCLCIFVTQEIELKDLLVSTDLSKRQIEANRVAEKVIFYEVLSQPYLDINANHFYHILIVHYFNIVLVPKLPPFIFPTFSHVFQLFILFLCMIDIILYIHTYICVCVCVCVRLGGRRHPSSWWWATRDVTIRADAV